MRGRADKQNAPRESMGKRKSVEENGQAEGDAAESPATRRKTAGGDAAELDSESPAARAGMRDRRAVKAFDPSTASTESPSIAKKSKAVKKTEPEVQEYTPDDKETFGTFIVQVENEWRDVNGFRVFEYKGTPKEIGEKTQFGKLREWYCSKQVEPPGGFKPGQQGFCPAGQCWNSLKFLTTSFVEVEIVHKIMDWGTYSRKFIEIVGEQDRVAEAYAKHPPDQVSQSQEGNDDEEGDAQDEEGEDAEEKVSSKKKVTPKKVAKKAPTAYLLFVNSKRSELLAEFPGITVPQLGVKCGELWRAMSAEEKEEFRQQGQALQREREAQGLGGSSSKKKKAADDDGGEEGAEPVKRKRGRKSKSSAAEEKAADEAEAGAEDGAGEGDQKEGDEGGENEGATAGDEGGEGDKAEDAKDEQAGEEGADAGEGAGGAAAAADESAS